MADGSNEMWLEHELLNETTQNSEFILRGFRHKFKIQGIVIISDGWNNDVSIPIQKFITLYKVNSTIFFGLVSDNTVFSNILVYSTHFVTFSLYGFGWKSEIGIDSES